MYAIRCSFFFVIFAETKGGNDTVVRGTMPQRIISCLETMDAFLRQPHPILESMVLTEKSKPGNAANKVSVVDAIINILGAKDIMSVNPNNSLSDFGMDSLMGTDIKQTLDKNYDLVLSAQEIRNLTFEKLQSLVNDSANDKVRSTPASSNKDTSTRKEVSKRAPKANRSTLN